jgi:hypothetical protein
LRVEIAGPHQTVNGNINEGFYQAKLPNSLISSWGVSNGSELSAAYKGEPKDFDATNTEDGIIIELDVTYSAGTVSVTPKANESETSDGNESIGEPNDGNESTSVADENNETGPSGAPPTELVSFTDTMPLTGASSGLRGKLRVESGVADEMSAELLRTTTTNYSLSLTAPDGTENVTVYLQSQAVESSQNIENISMYIDNSQQNFYLDQSAGLGNSSWIVFNVPSFSTRTVSFTSESNTTGATDSDVQLSDARLVPDSIGSAGTHRLLFNVSNVSADGQKDSFTVELPNSVTVENLNNTQVTNTAYEIINTERSGNTITFDVDPEESRDTVNFEVEVTMELANDSIK